MLSVTVNPCDVQPGIVRKKSESYSSVAKRFALRKMVLLSWSVGAVDAGSVPGGAVGAARFDVWRLGE
jgi:hypothetical protein